MAFETEETKFLLAKAINTLPEREKIVVTLYYYEGLTLAEIGQVLGVTESRDLPDAHQGGPAAPRQDRRAARLAATNASPLPAAPAKASPAPLADLPAPRRPWRSRLHGACRLLRGSATSGAGPQRQQPGGFGWAEQQQWSR